AVRSRPAAVAAAPSAAAVVGERQPLARYRVQATLRRRADLVERSVAGLGLLAAPDPVLAVVVARDESEVRREPDRMRPRLRRHDALRIGKRPVRPRGAPVQERRKTYRGKKRPTQRSVDFTAPDDASALPSPRRRILSLS